MTKYLEIKEKVKGIDPQTSILDKEGWLLYKLARKNDLGPIVEIGSWKGRSTLWLAQACIDKLVEDKQDRTYLVYAVDPHKGTGTHTFEGEVDTFKEFLSNIQRAGVDQIVRPVRRLSKEALSEIIWNDKITGLGLVFIDGSHDFEDVLWDSTNWGEALRIGGVLVLHDTIGYRGPRKALEVLMLTDKFKIIKVCGQMVALRRVEDSKWLWGQNYWMFIYWSIYSLLFLLAKRVLPRKIKEKLK